jgi:hypothetical protein
MTLTLPCIGKRSCYVSRRDQPLVAHSSPLQVLDLSSSHVEHHPRHCARRCPVSDGWGGHSLPEEVRRPLWYHLQSTLTGSDDPQTQTMTRITRGATDSESFLVDRSGGMFEWQPYLQGSSAEMLDRVSTTGLCFMGDAPVFISSGSYDRS